ncbi:hypothetical protein [Rathayibacter soli]|uniref:hypothetical protein n=1 Tax=Rathayibacter soli TaxID=3144168 RepID=UPI0027E4D517|nr:hypothetical protein [Glaciibacter superstes]
MYGSKGHTMLCALAASDGRFEWHFGTGENRFLQLLYRSYGLLDDLIEPVPYDLEPGRTYELEIDVEGGGVASAAASSFLCHPASRRSD